MAENKTQPNNQSVEAFIEQIALPQRREDSKIVAALMEKITQNPPKMWGESIVGFGDIHYKYASGREGDWFVVGFSPRKQNLTLYLMCGTAPLSDPLSRLGKHKVSGGSCIYINKLSDVNLDVLEEIIDKSVNIANQKTN